jgi:hypothetical protein
MTAPGWWSETLYPGTESSAVASVQVALRLPATGIMDEETCRKVRGIQRLWQLPETGTVDEHTATVLGDIEWYQKEPSKKWNE